MKKRVKVSVIGTSPPCIRCNRTYKLALEASKELGIDVELEKLTIGSPEAERYGRGMSLLEFEKHVGAELDISEELKQGDVEGIDRKAKLLLEQHKDAGVIVSPAVVINGHLKFFGTVPSKEELKDAIREAIPEG
ncbi:Thioredoxin domain protein [Candidatus Methanoperedenaceae archaeon GB37]|nr:Thioredoxin domain protein [Candidatus Methanoperedenaceae archaeon GB37]